MNRLIRRPKYTGLHVQVFFWIGGMTVLILGGFRTDDPAYREQLSQWHRQRLEALKAEDGWLNLAGLFWLKEGTNTVGANPGSNLIFPGDKVPAQLGVLRLASGQVTFEPAGGVHVQANGQPLVDTQTIFSADMAKPVTLVYGSLRWFVIKRGSRYAVRLRDLASPLLSAFKGVDRFPVNETFRVKARLDLPTTPRTIPILDVTGQTTQQPLIGTLVFDLGGQTHRLDAVGEGIDKLFIIFADATNNRDTYGAGRFLYADKPDANDPTTTGVVTLDFNRSINPPCAFTAFATCPLPPKQNRLSIPIPAGEKRYAVH